MGCFYKVRNLYGSEHRESFYDRALGEALKEAGLSFKDKPHVPVYSLQTGKKIAFFIPDKLVEGKIIIEVKAEPRCTPDDHAQIREYLKITD